MSNSKKQTGSIISSCIETKQLMDFVESLFAGYEETKTLVDFKEELVSNLNDKIENMVKKGVSGEEAFKKATSELGDISTLADEISLKKKQQVIGEAFMDIRHYMTPGRVAGYVAFGIILTFGILIAVISFFSTEAGKQYLPADVLQNQVFTHSQRNSFSLESLLGVLITFVPLSIAGFTWLGLTQELPGLYPLSKKRAFWYAGAAFLLSAGIILFPLVLFGTDETWALVSALSTLIGTALPAIGLFVFLGLTEKDRKKPWAKLHWEAEVKKHTEFWQDSASASRFGLFSGAIWIAAIGLFFLIGFLSGFQYSWTVFLFACALQLVIQGAMIKKKTE